MLVLSLQKLYGVERLHRHARNDPTATEPSLCEHLFVAEKGTPHGRFQRAIERRDLLGAEAAAREIGSLSLADALPFLLLLAEMEPRRFERAAVRWHARFMLEVRGLEIADSQLLLSALAGLREPVPRIALETIALVSDQFRSSSVALAAKRRLKT